MKKIILILTLMVPLLLNSRTYKCEFLKFVNGQSNTSINKIHTLDSKTTINYNNNFKVVLSTIFEDNEFTAYISIYQNNIELMSIDYWDSDFYPDFFIISYSIPKFKGECECILEN